MITILQLIGLGKGNEVKLVTTDKNGTRRFLEVDKVSPLLEPLNKQQFQHQKLLYGGVNNKVEIDIKPHIVYNSISDPDRCSTTLERVTAIAEKNNFPYINHPKHIPNIRPSRLYALAQNIENLITLKSARIKPESLTSLQHDLEENEITIPFIIKEVGTDPENRNSYLMENSSDIHDLERFAFDGRAYDVTPFYDYRSKDGLFRKHRFFVIGESVFPAHQITSDNWHITNDYDAHKDLGIKIKKILKDEKYFLKQYRTRQFPPLLALREKLELDFFAVDCHIFPDESILLFSVDCEAHYFERVKETDYYNEKQIQHYNEAVETMIKMKLQRWKEDNNV